MAGEGSRRRTPSREPSFSVEAPGGQEPTRRAGATVHRGTSRPQAFRALAVRQALASC